MNPLKGYKTYLAALIMLVMTANSLFHFIPAQYVETIWGGAGALGLFGIRKAIDGALADGEK